MHETSPSATRHRWRELGALVSVLAIVAACGISAQSPTPGGTSAPTSAATRTPTASGAPPPTAAGTAPATAGATGAPSATPEAPVPTPAGEVVFGNWPAYMQFSRRTGSFPMIDKFKQDTGIDAIYLEDVNDNSEFFNIIQPDLALGNHTGYDVIVLSDWMIERMVRLGYVQPLDYRLLSNFQANANELYVNPWYDPGNVYSVPWQAGIVGIGYNRALTGREITSFEDLLDPEFAGRVGLFSEMIDTMCLTILSLGVQCPDATIEDAARARDKLLEAAERGQFRDLYGNDYYDQLAGGNLALTMAWSGDVTQMKLYDNPDVEFVVPGTGGLLFVDNFVIPNHTPHYADAHAMIDFWYNVDNATLQTEWVGYFSPVRGVLERVLADAQTARDEGDLEWAGQLEVIAQTAVPTEEELANVFEYKILTEEEESTWNNLFNQVVID